MNGTIELGGCPREGLEDVGKVFSLLSNLPEKTDFPKGGEPNVFKYKGEGEAAWGVSGVILSGDSHLSLHTFPEKGDVFINIFSSRQLNAELIERELSRAFQAASCQSNREAVFQESAAFVPDIEGTAAAPRIYH